MAKQELLELPGTVSELLPNATFRVKLDNEHEIIARRQDAQEPHPRARGRQSPGGNDTL